LPFLADMTLGQLCHFIHLAIQQHQLLGYCDGVLVPFERSESKRIQDCARDRVSPHADMNFSCIQQFCVCLRGILERAPGSRVQLSNIKRLLKSEHDLNVSQTAFGYTRFREFIETHPTVREICDVIHESTGYVVILRPKVVHLFSHLDMPQTPLARPSREVPELLRLSDRLTMPDETCTLRLPLPQVPELPSWTFAMPMVEPNTDDNFEEPVGSLVVDQVDHPEDWSLSEWSPHIPERPQVEPQANAEQFMHTPFTSEPVSGEPSISGKSDFHSQALLLPDAAVQEPEQPVEFPLETPQFHFGCLTAPAACCGTGRRSALRQSRSPTCSQRHVGFGMDESLLFEGDLCSDDSPCVTPKEAWDMTPMTPCESHAFFAAVGLLSQEDAKSPNELTTLTTISPSVAFHDTLLRVASPSRRRPISLAACIIQRTSASCECADLL